MGFEQHEYNPERNEGAEVSRRDLLRGAVVLGAGAAFELSSFEKALAGLDSGDAQKKELLQVMRYVYHEDKSALEVFRNLRLSNEKIQALHDVTLNALRTVCKLNETLTLRQGLAHSSFLLEARKQLAMFTIDDVVVFSISEQKAIARIFERIQLRAKEAI